MVTGLNPSVRNSVRIRLDFGLCIMCEKGLCLHRANGIIQIRIIKDKSQSRFTSNRLPHKYGSGHLCKIFIYEEF